MKSVTFADNSLEVIGPSAFFGCAIENIVLPSSVTTIGESAFEGCSDLTSVTLPAGVTTISKSAFETCTSLETINLENITEIGAEAFKNCSALSRVLLPEGLETIGESAFYFSDDGNFGDGLEYINIPSTVKSLGNQFLTMTDDGVIVSAVADASIFTNTAISGFGDATLIYPAEYADAYEQAGLGPGSDLTTTGYGISISNTAVVEVGKTLTVTTTVPTGYKLTANSGNDTIAIAALSDDGSTLTITGVAQGTTTISVSIVSNDESITLVTKTCAVTVATAVVPVESVSLDQGKLNLYVGDHATLTATVLPANATDKAVTWQSSNTAVATVDQNGLVKAVGPGTAIITATAGGKTATCVVTVTTYFVPTQPGAGSSSYNVSVASATHGKVAVSPTAAPAGTLVTVTTTPDAGYQLASLTVTAASGVQQTLTPLGNGKFTFTMPASSVTVAAVFQAEAAAAPTEPTAPDGWVNPFTDVTTNAWYYDAVGYASANGLMGGTSATTFAPESPMNRAMVWTVIARLAGQTITGANWVEDARTWAMAQGVSDGTNPDANVTREELVTMLYRYAGSPEMNVPELGLINGYPDSADISDWAQNAFAWALSTGIIDGRDGKLAAGDSVTRAEAATILARFHMLSK